MSLTTRIATTTYVDPEQVFLQARRLIGIPADQPAEIETKVGDAGTWIEITSVPGEFESALSVNHNAGRPIPGFGDEQAVEADFVLTVRFDSGYDEAGVYTEALHRFLSSQLGAWFEAQGASWLALDEYTQVWHELTPCPL